MLKLGLKVAVSAALLALILIRIDIGALERAIAGLDTGFIAVAFLLSLAMILTDAALWRSVLNSLNHRISIGGAVLYSVVGSFFGNLAPSTVGVDVFRATRLHLAGVSIDIAIRAVITTRLVSFVSLLAVIATGVPIALGYDLGIRDLLVLATTFAAGLAILAGLLGLYALQVRVPILQQSVPVKKLIDVSSDLTKALTSRCHTVMSLVHSTSTHILRILTFAAIAAAFHAPVSLAALYALIPLAMLVAMVPISLASWGIREASLIHFLSWVDVPPAMALSISVMFGLLRIWVAAIGGFVWIFARADHFKLVGRLD